MRETAERAERVFGRSVVVLYGLHRSARSTHAKRLRGNNATHSVGMLAWAHYIYHYVGALLHLRDYWGLAILGGTLAQSVCVAKLK